MNAATREAATARPNRLDVQRLASEGVAREFVEKIPEFADYVEREGLEQLVQHTLTAILSVGREEKKRLEAGLKLERSTGVLAAHRAGALFGGFKRHEREAEISLLGGWIGQMAMDPPFSGPFSGAVLKSSNGGREVVAFRTAELDEVGQVKVVPMGELSKSHASVQIAPWEKLTGFRPVVDAVRPSAQSRSSYWTAHHAKYFADLSSPEKMAEIDAEFAAGAFKEMPPEARFDHLRDLGAAISHAEDATEMFVLLRRLSAITHVANLHDFDIPDPAYDPAPRP